MAKNNTIPIRDRIKLLRITLNANLTTDQFNENDKMEHPALAPSLEDVDAIEAYIDKLEKRIAILELALELKCEDSNKFIELAEKEMREK